jgi:hypothetical protein
MKKVISAVLILGILVSGCTHNLGKYDNETRNEYIDRISSLCQKHDEITFEMQDGKKIIGALKLITTDSITIRLNNTKQDVILQTKTINSISFSENEKSGLYGFFWGLWIGAGAGLTLGQINNEPLGKLYYLVYSTLIGGIVGLMYGIIAPGQTIIKLN